MTVRYTMSTAATPEEVAALIQPHTVNGIQELNDYRTYTDELEVLVEQITRVSDRGLTLEVSKELGTSVSDWYRYRLNKM